ncbi:MAG: hypothetical protein L6R40_002647 [Gallowayella cf. fulva]|nr:MAG: hypothetical protein L6R40_002647 [Xanthomendoza cf. fulva]
MSFPPPAFSDIAKASNDLINRDFYHSVAANLEVKSKAPNGVNFTVKGKSSHEGSTNGSVSAGTSKPSPIHVAQANDPMIRLRGSTWMHRRV